MVCLLLNLVSVNPTYPYALYQEEKLRVRDLRKNICGYKEAIEQVERGLGVDGYDSDSCAWWRQRSE